MKKLVWIWVLVLASDPCASQALKEIDSLQEILRNNSTLDETKIRNVTSLLAWTFYNDSHFDSASVYYLKALKTSTNYNNPAWSGTIYFGLGSSYVALGRQDSAIVYYKKALVELKTVKAYDNIALASINLSIIYKNQGLYEEALENVLAAARILEKTKPSYSLGLCYNTIASIFVKIKGYSEATAYYNKAISLFAKSDTANLAKSYNNLGELFILTHQYDSARINLNRAAELKR